VLYHFYWYNISSVTVCCITVIGTALTELQCAVSLILVQYELSYGVLYHCYWYSISSVTVCFIIVIGTILAQLRCAVSLLLVQH